MALTGAQRQKEYRRRLKQEDPSAYEAMMQETRKRTAQWKKEHPDQVAAHNKNHRFYSYGLTQTAVATLFAQQDSKCGICSKELDLQGKWVIDHNHDTGEVRGILCYPCNVAIGQFQDSPAMLMRAIQWIEK